MSEHHSHNFSSATFICYGCGIAVDDVRVHAPCPTPDHVGAAHHPMQPYIKNDEIDLPEPVILNTKGERAEYRPTLPPVAHDPLNMRDYEPDLRALYPKIKELDIALASPDDNDPIKRALRQELSGLSHQATGRLIALQKLLAEQRVRQDEFNRAYADIELILAKFPELLKP